MVSKATTAGLSSDEVKKVMSGITEDKDALLKVEKELVDQLGQTLKGNDLKGMDLSAKTVDDLVSVAKALEASGMSEEDAAIVLRKLAEGLMDKNDIAAIVDACKNVPKELKAKLPGMLQSLNAQKLAEKADSESLENVISLAKAMEKAGLSKDEINATLSKATKEGLSESEAAEVMGQLKDKNSVILGKPGVLDKLQKTLKSGELQAAGMKPDVLKNVMALSEALEAAGMSKSDVNDILAKVISGELSPEEADKIIKKLSEAEDVSDELKARLPQLAESLRSDALVVDGLDKDQLDQVLTLAKALKESGANDEEIERIVARATGSGLDEKEVRLIINL